MRDQHALTFFLVKMDEVAVIGLWLAAVVWMGCLGWEVHQVTWRWAHPSIMASMQVMQLHPVTPFKNDCFLRGLLGPSSYLIFLVKPC